MDSVLWLPAWQKLDKYIHADMPPCHGITWEGYLVVSMSGFVCQMHGGAK